MVEFENGTPAWRSISKATTRYRYFGATRDQGRQTVKRTRAI